MIPQYQCYRLLLWASLGTSPQCFVKTQVTELWGQSCLPDLWGCLSPASPSLPLPSTILCPPLPSPQQCPLGKCSRSSCIRGKSWPPHLTLPALLKPQEMTLLAAMSCNPEDNDRGTEAPLSQLTCPFGCMPVSGNIKLKIQWENISLKKQTIPCALTNF